MPSLQFRNNESLATLGSTLNSSVETGPLSKHQMCSVKHCQTLWSTQGVYWILGQAMVRLYPQHVPHKCSEHCLREREGNKDCTEWGFRTILKSLVKIPQLPLLSEARVLFSSGKQMGGLPWGERWTINLFQIKCSSVGVYRRDIIYVVSNTVYICARFIW